MHGIYLYNFDSIGNFDIEELIIVLLNVVTIN